MATDFLGQGWCELDESAQTLRWLHKQTRQVALSSGEDNIQQAIWIILGTAKGERVMRPDFGCAIHDLVFSVMSPTTAGHAAEAVRQALIQWEPRIEVLDVAAAPDPHQPNLLLIEIEYRVRTTNNRFNVVYPFYLE